MSSTLRLERRLAGLIGPASLNALVHRRVAGQGAWLQDMISSPPQFSLTRRPIRVSFLRFDMPKRTDIHSVLIIGAGPIIIGQACEFDYSGTQACKALREEGYRVSSSTPTGTIMTNPEFADRTYIEPITPECVEKIIIREKEEMKRLGARVNSFCSPHSAARPPLKPRCPPQKWRTRTARRGNDRREPDAIHKGEDRFAFKELMLQIGLDVPSPVSRTTSTKPATSRRRSASFRSSSARRSRSRHWRGIGYNQKSLPSPERHRAFSPVNEILIEESLLAGRNTRWK